MFGIETRTRLRELLEQGLFREVKAEGYPGGYGQVKRYARDKKDEIFNGERSTPNG